MAVVRRIATIFRRFHHDQLHPFGVDWKLLPRLVGKLSTPFPPPLPNACRASRVEVVGPYVVGVNAKGIEVKSFDKLSKTVQTMEIHDVLYMSLGNALYVTTKNTCYALQMLPMDLQVWRLSWHIGCATCVLRYICVAPHPHKPVSPQVDKLILAKDYEQAERLAVCHALSHVVSLCHDLSHVVRYITRCHILSAYVILSCHCAAVDGQVRRGACRNFEQCAEVTRRRFVYAAPLCTVRDGLVGVVQH
jgi:hypothetical protein